MKDQRLRVFSPLSRFEQKIASKSKICSDCAINLPLPFRIEIKEISLEDDTQKFEICRPKKRKIFFFGKEKLPFLVAFIMETTSFFPCCVETIFSLQEAWEKSELTVPFGPVTTTFRPLTVTSTPGVVTQDREKKNFPKKNIWNWKCKYSVSGREKIVQLWYGGVRAW